MAKQNANMKVIIVMRRKERENKMSEIFMDKVFWVVKC